LPDLLRIAYLVDGYPAVNHTFILREIVALRSRGFEVEVVAIHGNDRPLERMTELERSEHQRTFRILPAGMHVFTAHASALLRHPIGFLGGLIYAVQLGSRNNIKSLFMHLAYFAEAIVAGHRIESMGIRHFHSHFTSTVALLASRIFGLPFSMTIHGPAEFDDVLGFHIKDKVAASRFVVTISNFGRSQVMRASDPKDWDKLEVCYLGVDPALFGPAPPRPERSPWNLMFVGRLAPVKAQRVLIQACSLARHDLRLRLVGSGPDRQVLEQYAVDCGVKDRVLFEGPRNQDEVVALYRDTDIFVLASFAEGVPVVLMEAMAMEIPCVATWVNGIPELIEHETSGVLVAPADPAALAAAVDRLAADPELRRRLGKKGREKVVATFNLNTNADLLARIFRRRLSGAA
jgi:colanic acid/amylovoran biosynthesis glycosyltransferase